MLTPGHRAIEDGEIPGALSGAIADALHLKAKSLRQYAEKAELDLQRYDPEMGDHVYLRRVQEHIESGTRSRVRSTPAFFVNGVVHDVSFGFEHQQRAIETELGA